MAEALTGGTAEIICPICGARLYMPYSLERDPVTPAGEISYTLIPDGGQIRAHLATHGGSPSMQDAS